MGFLLKSFTTMAVENELWEKKENEPVHTIQ